MTNLYYTPEDAERAGFVARHDVEYRGRVRSQGEALASRQWQCAYDADAGRDCTCDAAPVEIGGAQHRVGCGEDDGPIIGDRYPEDTDDYVPTRSATDGMFVAPDADGRPTIWHEPEPGHHAPTAVLAQPPSTAPMRLLWDLATAFLPERA
jgi:hypothetical protein